MPLDPDLLTAFVAVACRGGFTAAGQALGRSQSTVSAQIRRFEDEVRLPLFVRTSHTVRLTAEGTVLLTYAGRLLELADKAMSATRSDAQKIVLRVGCLED